MGSLDVPQYRLTNKSHSIHIIQDYVICEACPVWFKSRMLKCFKTKATNFYKYRPVNDWDMEFLGKFLFKGKQN